MDGDSPDVLANANNASPTYVPPWSFLPAGFSNIQLDIVGFLAILGEASVLNNSQVAALSWTSCIPRLIPAPQALIRTQRPARLQTSSGVVIGPQSGNVRRHINHITHILHQIAFHENKIPNPELTPYSVAAITINWAEDDDGDTDKDKAANHVVGAAAGEKLFNLKFWKTSSKKAKHAKSVASFKPFGWQVRLTFLGCTMSIGILVASCWYGDGMSVLAVLCLSSLSSLVGLVNFYTLELPKRVADRDLDPSDVVIYYPNGSFLVVVDCPIKIAHLYFQSEQCKYLIQDRWQYRSICLAATMLLMVGVICLANATEWLQVAWAGCYIILNAAYWAVAALPARKHWDMSGFKTGKVERMWYKYTKGSTTPELCDVTARSERATFTEALWKTIGITEGSMWARTAEIAPATPDWDDWLREAEKQANNVTEGPGSPRQADREPSTGTSTSRVASEQADPEKGCVVNGDSARRTLKAERKAARAKSQKIMTLPKWNYTEELTKFLSNKRRPHWAVTTVSDGTNIKSTANTDIAIVSV